MSALTMILESTGSGFSGFSSYDPATDDLGHMTMTEAAAYLPIVIMENSIEAAREEAKVNDALVESVVMARLSGSEPDYQAISENALQSAWAKIKNFFKKIIEAIKRIIAKIRVFIDSYFMKAKAFATKYENSPELKNKDFSKLTFSGYKFVDNIGSIWDDKLTVKNIGEVNGLAQVAVSDTTLKAPEDARRQYRNEASDSNKMDTLAKTIDKLKDISSEDRKSKLFTHITTKPTMDGDNVRESLLKILMGSEGKVELKYGSDGFVLQKIISYLKTPDDISDLEKKYQDMEKGARDFVSKAEKAANDNVSYKNLSDEHNTKAESLYASYISLYGNIVSDVYDMISVIQDAKTTAAKAKIRQNMTMLRIMINTDKKKLDKMNEEFEDFDDSEFDLDI